MCEQGFFGANCEIPQLSHYIMETTRKTPYPYLVPPLAVLLIIFVGICHFQQSEFFCTCGRGFVHEYFQNVQRTMSNERTVYAFLHRYNASLMFLNFVMDIGYVGYFKSFVAPYAIKVAMSGSAYFATRFFGRLWHRMAERYENTLVAWITIINTTFELAYHGFQLILSCYLVNLNEQYSSALHFYLIFQATIGILEGTLLSLFRMIVQSVKLRNIIDDAHVAYDVELYCQMH